MQETIIVAGVINATGKMLYWKSNDGLSVGDYAIVENANGYDLIKVVGIVITEKNLVKNFSKTSYEYMKETKGKVEIKGNQH